MAPDVAALALGALRGSQWRRAELHVRACGACGEERALLETAAVALAFGPPSFPPPATSRARLLREAREEQQHTVVIPLRRRLALPATATLATAAAGAAATVALWASGLAADLDRTRAARAADLGAMAVLTDPTAHRYPLSTVGFVTVTRTRAAALVVRTLDQAPAGRSYQAWVVVGGTAAPAALFRGGPTIVAFRRPVPTGAVVAVTLERAGGAEHPTGPLLVRTETG